MPSALCPTLSALRPMPFAPCPRPSAPLKTIARTRERVSGQNRAGKAYPANGGNSNPLGSCTDWLNNLAYIEAYCTTGRILIADFGLGRKSVKVQGFASDLMVEFTENSLGLKSVKEVLVWSSVDYRKQPWAEIGKSFL